MIELNQMLTIYSPLDILHLSYRTLVFEKFKAREDQVAPPPRIRQIGSEA